MATLLTAKLIAKKMPFNAWIGTAAAVLLAGLCNSALGAMVPVTTVAQKPLVVSSFAEPNIMFLLDSSGSMDNIVEESYTSNDPYDASTNYASAGLKSAGMSGSSCDDSSATAISPPSAVWLYVDSTGTAKVEISGTIYNFGYASGDVCFNTDDTYNAKLRTDWNVYTTSYGYADFMGYASYTGNFLNWYFSNATDHSLAANFGAGATRRRYYDAANSVWKDSVRTRLETMKDTMGAVLSGLSEVRVGLATYDMNDSWEWSGMNSDPFTQGALSYSDYKEGLNSGNTAAIRVQLKDISSNRLTMYEQIGIDPSTLVGNEGKGVDAFGSTPLAKALAAIGRYMIIGHESDTVTEYPDNAYGGTPTQTTASTILSVVPVYRSPAPSDNPMAKDSSEWCRQNFIITLTDGLPTNDNSSFDSPSHPIHDYDRDCIGLACSHDKKPGDTSGVSSDYLDDVAGALNDIDWLPGIKAPDGTAHKNNIVSYFVGFADPSLANSQLMADAAANGGGLYLTAKDSTTLKDSLDKTLLSISSKVGSMASVAFNSSSLDTGSSVFIAQFNTARWSGKLYNYELDPSTGLFKNPGTSKTSNSISGVSPEWEAGSILDSTSYNNRTILTYDGSNGVAFDVASLTATPSLLSTAMVNDLSAGNGTATEVMQYLMGDRTLEGAKFRSRDSKLGDIIDSTPAFIGKPSGGYPDDGTGTPFPTGTNNYATWKAKYQDGTLSREPMVFIGANDGMLHVFDANLTTGANGGKELMAYVPNFLASSAASSGLHYLSSNSYSHQFYVDQSVSAADVYITGPGASTPSWMTVVVGGARAGGRGLYALRLPDTGSTFTTNDVLWEFSSADDGDLGYTFSRPTVAMAPTPADTGGTWTVIVGNGYASDNGVAKLFILDLADGIKNGWTLGTNYWVVDTKVGSTAVPNGLSSPRVVDENGDGVADRIYAGDLYGNLWCFDFNGTAWESCYSTSGKNGVPVPLFQTTASSYPPDYSTLNSQQLQPITTTPLVASVGGTTGLTVFFGTGQYLLDADLTNTDPQAFYAVNDIEKNTPAPLKPSDLAERTISTVTLSSGNNVRTISGTPSDWWNNTSPSYSGWYMKLPASGERTITRPTIISDTLFFNTIIPDSSTCSSGGTGWLMSVDFSTGLAPKEPIFDATKDGNINADDVGYVGEEFTDGLPSESRVLGSKRYTAGSNGTITVGDVNVNTTSREGRLSWEELN